jgi:phenylacetate-CoA ligase
MEELYHALPLWAQNLAISAYGLRYRHERLGGDFARYVSQFGERDSWPAHLMKAYVETRLRAVLSVAFRFSRHYADAWRARGLTETHLQNFRLSDLRELPIVSKEDLRRDPESFVALDPQRKSRLIRYHTSGSTGTPLTVTYSEDAHRQFIAAREVRSFGWAGTSILAPRSMLGGRMVVQRHDSPPPYHRLNFTERQIYFSAYHISKRNLPYYVETLNRHRPEVLTGYAFSHYLLARLMMAGGLRLQYHPKALVLSSEKLTAEMKEVIGSAFGARPYEEYGLVENCALATECEHGSLHVSPDFGVVEIVDGEGRPVEAGEEGQIVATGLLNDVQPLVRYQTGDLGSWSTEPCPCGRNQLPVIREIGGRVEELVIGDNGHLMVRFHGILINLPHVLAGQFIQETRTRIRVRVLATSEFGDAEIATIRRRISDERLGNMEVIVEQVSELERTARGKIRAVINRLPREEILAAMGEQRDRATSVEH